ncbi:UvrABC system protein A [bacterium BMS3Abin09]|nr:UvrABC system protein A [bacterium BMS3Abin09]GBE41859.1 UvrABC system protein A [bacterium BMS3Bbin09]
MSAKELIIEGARQNNLRNISLRLPHNKFITVTGVSGSGKSSLAFDTIFAEGQWRFIESLSTYARLFLEKLDRPEVDSIRNIRPAIALEQRNTVKGSRSTVGTVTEIYDYLRLFYSKIAKPHCPECGQELMAWTPSSAARELVDKYARKKALIIFETDDAPEELQKKGFHRFRGIEGGKHDVILDRLIIKNEPRLSDSIEIAWEHGNHSIKIEIVGDSPEDNELLRFHAEPRCHECGVGISNPQPLIFSFNHPVGACPACKGFGNILEYSEEYIIPDQDLSFNKGAVQPWSKPAYRWWYRQFAREAKKEGIDLTVPYKELPQKEKDLLYKGTPDCYGLDGFFEYLESKRYKLHVRVFLSRYRKAAVCPECKGKRLKPEALAFRMHGRDISELSGMSIIGLSEYFSGLKLSEYEAGISDEILRQINLKLEFLIRIGIGYLTLSRETRSLSGGELQRISLANQIASRLTGTLYVLDEPTVGLHPKDVSKIAEILRELAEAGNTVIAVEHDKTIIDASDWIVELGPGGGSKGGRLVYAGSRKDFEKAETLTAQYLRDKGMIALPKQRKKGSGKTLSLKGADGHNLKHIDINISLNVITCVTGVSGSGKSTIVKDTLYRAVSRHFKQEFDMPQPFVSIEGLEHLKGIKIIDQQPIGKSPRSNPVTYIKAFDHIRKLFAGQPQSLVFGYTPGHFSFNTDGGRCEVCSGEGFQKLEMYFFEDLYIRCEECRGRRYKPEILDVKYNGKNIYEVLKLTVDEAVIFFNRVKPVVKKLKLMSSVGLGYLRLGQPATTLSGGEAQRLKICAELGVLNRKDHLYILDEPTVGLHPDDIKKLLEVLDTLIKAGNTVLLVEHNMDVIKSADMIIDIGPGGGDDGGRIVAEGTPEEVSEQEGSHTGKYLKEYL